jgi:hypothetical protein
MLSVVEESNTSLALLFLLPVFITSAYALAVKPAN